MTCQIVVAEEGNNEGPYSATLLISSHSTSFYWCFIPFTLKLIANKSFLFLFYSFLWIKFNFLFFTSFFLSSLAVSLWFCNFCCGIFYFSFYILSMMSFILVVTMRLALNPWELLQSILSWWQLYTFSCLPNIFFSEFTFHVVYPPAHFCGCACVC